MPSRCKYRRESKPPLLLLLLLFLLLFSFERSLFYSVCLCVPFFFAFRPRLCYVFEQMAGSLFLLRERFSQTTLPACLGSFVAKREKGLSCVHVSHNSFFFLLSFVWNECVV